VYKEAPLAFGETLEMKLIAYRAIATLVTREHASRRPRALVWPRRVKRDAKNGQPQKKKTPSLMSVTQRTEREKSAE
jgi:hypothetical protein